MNIPPDATHPGTVIADEIKARKIKKKEFAEMLGISLTELKSVLKGNAPVF